jgi:hypothetical protein
MPEQVISMLPRVYCLVSRAKSEKWLTVPTLAVSALIGT